MFHHSHDPKEIVFFPYVYPYVGLAASLKNRDHGLPHQDVQYLNWGLSAGRLFKRLRDAVAGWSGRRHAHRALFDMDDRMLDDIGITRGDIEDVIDSRSWSLLAGLKKVVADWLERDRARRALYAMDDWMLADIGISRGDIERVIGRRYDGPNAVKPATPEKPAAEIHTLVDAGDMPMTAPRNDGHKHAA